MRSLAHPLLRRSRHGGTILIVALVLMVLLGFIALVVDLGYSRLIRSQVQMGAEAASIAATLQLDGTEDGVTAATDAALAFASTNTVAGAPMELSSGDLEFGVWDGADFTTSSDATAINAVRVAPSVDGVNVFFAAVTWDTDALSVNGQATTTKEWGAAGGVDCFLPLAIPSCLLEDRYDLETVTAVDITLRTSSSGIDNMGWAMPGGGTPGSSWLRSQVLDCEYDGEVAVGEMVGLNNGVITSVMTALANTVSRSSTRWDSSVWGAMPARSSGSSIPLAKWGNTYEAPIMVFENDAYCSGSGGAFNGAEVISGFVWGAVYDVVNSSTSTSKTIKMRLDTVNTYDYGTRLGGAEYGIIYIGPPTFVN